MVLRAYIDLGKDLFKGKDLLCISEDEIRNIRGKEIAMIFQNPSSSLNPVFQTGFQVAEVINLHQGIFGEEADSRVVELFDKVGIPEPAVRAKDNPQGGSSKPSKTTGGM